MLAQEPPRLEQSEQSLPAEQDVYSAPWPLRAWGGKGEGGEGALVRASSSRVKRLGRLRRPAAPVVAVTIGGVLAAVAA